MGTEGKTEIKTLGEGIQYLGYKMTPSKISIRKSSFDRMFSNLSKVLTCFRYKKDHEKHIFRINLKISGCIINNSRRGWIMFFSQTDDISQLAYLDSWLDSEIENLDIDKTLIKKFKKSYYEIRFNLKNSSYINNFDNYDINQKKDVIKILSKKSLEEIDVMDIEMIDYEFNRLIGREVSELERDVVEAFS